MHKNSVGSQLATQLGMHSQAMPVSQTHSHTPNSEGSEPKAWPVVDNTKDYFIEKNGKKYAGTHLLVDVWGAENLDDIDIIEKTLRKGADDAGATILHCHLHHFTPNGGVSGVLVLAESHISIHTWPEKGFAALDVFMCGACDPHKAIPAIESNFKPDRIDVSEEWRGVST
jgi:S-adenosylmethionine decarboxylase